MCNSTLNNYKFQATAAGTPTNLDGGRPHARVARKSTIDGRVARKSPPDGRIARKAPLDGRIARKVAGDEHGPIRAAKDLKLPQTGGKQILDSGGHEIEKQVKEALTKMARYD